MTSLSDYFLSALLGLIEGLTEFIPVSSTGHLILFIDILGFAGPPGKVFEIVIQLGAILAVCWLYRKKLWETVLGAVREIFVASERKNYNCSASEVKQSGALCSEQEPSDCRVGVSISSQNDFPHLHFVVTLFIAFLPAAVIGVFAHSFIKEVLFSPLVVSVMLVVGGVLILIIERYKPNPHIHDVGQLTFKRALLVGLCQSLAMIPGTSRSGATIMGGLLLGLDRKTATEFSFFLAIPTMLGATVYDLYKNWSILSFDNALMIAIGFLTAFLAALVVVRFVIVFISKHGFAPFAYYRIMLGSIMLAYFLA